MFRRGVHCSRAAGAAAGRTQLRGRRRDAVVRARLLATTTAKNVVEEARPPEIVSKKSHIDDALLARLERVCAECTTNEAIRQRHGKDESHHACVAPELVAFPASSEEVSGILRVCGEARCPVIPFGTGTSLEGHIQALHGGVCVDVGAKMTSIVEENVEDMDARVEAGVTRVQLNERLRHSGLRFNVDPGADASLGGMAACGASGTLAMKYGTMRENVTGLSVVLADGSVVETGARAKKSSAGYDLTKLFIGSEGTLGVITEVAVRLHPEPAVVAAAKAGFATVREAADAVSSLLALGLHSLRRCELLDAATVAAFNTYNAQKGGGVAAVPERATLFLEFGDVSEVVVEAHVACAREACEETGAEAFEWSVDEAEARELWKARHATYYAALALKRDGRAIVTDSCVPLSAFADVVDSTVADVRASDVVGPVFGHAGDGNIHCILTYAPDDDAAYLERLHGVAERIVQRTLDAGGSISGEHGVGAGKRHWLRRQYSDATMRAMRAVKDALDPLGIMNPGKIL